MSIILTMAVHSYRFGGKRYPSSAIYTAIYFRICSKTHNTKMTSCPYDGSVFTAARTAANGHSAEQSVYITSLSLLTSIVNK